MNITSNTDLTYANWGAGGAAEPPRPSLCMHILDFLYFNSTYFEYIPVFLIFIILDYLQLYNIIIPISFTFYYSSKCNFIQLLIDVILLFNLVVFGYMRPPSAYKGCLDHKSRDVLADGGIVVVAFRQRWNPGEEGEASREEVEQPSVS